MEAELYTEEDQGKARRRIEVVSKTSSCLLIKKYMYKATGSVADYRPNTRPKKLRDIHYRFIDEKMSKDDELTRTKLQRMLKQEFPDISVSLSTVKRAKHELEWVVVLCFDF